MSINREIINSSKQRETTQCNFVAHIQKLANNNGVLPLWHHTAESLHDSVCLDHSTSSSRDVCGAAVHPSHWMENMV